MFAKIAQFFIENWKLTFVLVLVTLITGFGSYMILPKQYNPTIVVPAFQVIVPALWLEAPEISKIIVSPLENKIMELEWIDEVYWIAWDNYGWVMAKFNVWVDKEKAKIRLIQKIRENMFLKPIWVSEPIIKTIDPDELSQIVFSISLKSNNIEKEEENYIYLRQVTNIIKDELKSVKNTTTLEIVWWYKKDLIVELDLDKIEASNIDVMQIYEALQKNNISQPAWNIISKTWEKIFIESHWKIETKNDLEKLIVANYNWNIIYLEDVANIRFWTKKIDKFSTFTDSNWKSPAVFIWIWKALWTNAVFVTKDVTKRLEEIKKELPSNIKINIISNQWEKAENATNMLLINLVQSILIVFAVLAFYLWARDAFNTAVSIPLTLWMVFVFAFVAWEDINKITLFALILVLWMLVDNSTVVVENISRHLKDRIKTWKTKLEATLEWVQEVWTWVILATLTRLLAFGSMFAVTWMMWEYMNPIPKFAIWALLISIAIAFTINPWISYLWAKDITESDRNKKDSQVEKESKFKIRQKYLRFMKIFLDDTKKANKNRKKFKYTFWISLFLILVLPIYFWIFKARMLPKSNQNQIYIWIDAPREYSAKKTKEIEEYLVEYLMSWEKFDYIKNISSTIWQSYIWDFANLFRWWSNRIWENQISTRINLFSPNQYKELRNKSRNNSEKITIDLRVPLKKYLLEKYPDIKISLLEDPPGPPVKATFLIKIKWNASNENQDIFINKVQKEIFKISKKEDLVDIYNSKSSTYKKIKLNLDLERISRAWLTMQQVEYSMWIILTWIETNLIKNTESFEPTNITIIWNIEQNSLSNLEKITFTNNKWEKIPLWSITNLEYNFVSPDINTDKKEKTTYISWEMWDNSLIYPVIKLFWIFLNDNFLWDNYKINSWNLYKIEYLWLSDWKKYIIEWWWEWKLTMDTFRDLWMAMFISLLAIYFVLVWQFSSFKISWVIMITFLIWFLWVWPWFTFLYLVKNEYFSATSMIWIIALAWIVVWNAIILIDYINVLKKNGLTLKDALLKAWYVRFAPIILTSLTTVFWAATIVWDPVWSGLAWAIIWGLSISSILTLIVIPIFYYESQKNSWK